ncbi:spore germination protein KA [Neobacillus bataviensis LMG 21833]|uniref:Spore germination protein KA n=1 Tax=Neobacillus bataviensis LMG 21833 TaxID=1117379 RepID=K6E093_9BACI|nr:spore germination protein [Neobacillus bataviensis]EKN66556.1 spore germination protein KA [Neobacillus bataviensis LMG 21833]
MKFMGIRKERRKFPSLQMNESLNALPEIPLDPELNKNIDLLKSAYKDCSDVVFREFSIGGSVDAILLYIDGLSNTEEIDQQVLRPLLQMKSDAGGAIVEHTKKEIAVSDLKEIYYIVDVFQQISMGNPIILIEKQTKGISIGLPKWEKRSIMEPDAESVIRGPREGFIETVRVNTSLLRRKIRHPLLKMKPMTIGRYTETQIIISYIEGIADITLVDEVTSRIERIKMDGILESGYIEEMIVDYPYSPFAQVLTTERPDVAAACLLEGRVVILVDGTPISLIAPCTFATLLQAPEDYYNPFYISTFIRWLRYLFFFIALLAPSAYVAILTYHQEMLPTSLLLTIAESREQIPFPALIEAFIMEITFEALREAGVRLPKQVGSAVSIVGALVIGQAATAAGLVSSPMVMVVAITGVASFLMPRYATGISVRILRFPIMILAGMLGLLGVMLGITAIVAHLCTLKSFGVPYFNSAAPLKAHNLKDVLIRAPWWAMDTRPDFFSQDTSDLRRESSNQKPDPSKGGDGS